MTALDELYLLRTKVGDAGLVHLKNLKQLKRLELRDTAVKGPGLVNIEGLKNLKVLDFAETTLTDEGLAHLKGLDRAGAARPVGHPRHRRWPGEYRRASRTCNT